MSIHPHIISSLSAFIIYTLLFFFPLHTKEEKAEWVTLWSLFSQSSTCWCYGDPQWMLIGHHLLVIGQAPRLAPWTSTKVLGIFGVLNIKEWTKMPSPSGLIEPQVLIKLFSFFDVGISSVMWSLIIFINNVFGVSIYIGSGFKSVKPFRSGYFGANIKLQPGYTAGVITSLYVRAK